jgi:hypothetical protein
MNPVLSWPPPMGTPVSDMLPLPVPEAMVPACLPTNPALGSWTYRSFVNNPDILKDFNDLEFGRGELTIDELAPGHFEGRLSFADSYQFRLRGLVDFSSYPYAVRFQGIGDTEDSRGQVYDYVGFFVPMWSNGVDQRPAIVGSAVRTVAHNGNQARAGVVGTFIALKRDEESR